MKKPLTIYPSVYLLVAMIVSNFSFFIFGPAVFLYALFTSEKNAENIVGFSFFIFVSIGCGTLLWVDKGFRYWLTKIKISEKDIKIHNVFEKTKTLDFSIHKKVFYGYMVVRGIPEWFIIISNRTLSRYELENLNKIKQTDDYIKIKYSKKRREQLMEILPQNMAVQLKNPPPGKR